VATLCPHCGRAPRRSTGGGGISAGLPAFLTVLFCPGCCLFAIEGVDVWITPAERLGGRLVELAKQAPPILAIDQRKREIVQFRQDLLSRDAGDERWWTSE
jgi:hypothetical protein